MDLLKNLLLVRNKISQKKLGESTTNEQEIYLTALESEYNNTVDNKKREKTETESEQNSSVYYVQQLG
jgi:hypothetical protein